MKTVYLSPSTQDKNIGYADYGTEEIRMNQIADEVQKVLKEHRVIVYRNNLEMTLKDIVKDSNSKKPDIHFAIHSNACNGVSRGCEIFCHKFGGNGEKLAKAVYSEIEPLTPTKDRGIKEGANRFGKDKPLYETAYTFAPAALVEVAFHDNPKDAEWIISNITSIGIAIAKGILNYFEIPFQQQVNPAETEIDWLAKNGVISSPMYWKSKLMDVDYLDCLFIQMYKKMKGIGD